MAERYKKGFLVFFAALLFLPLLQKTLHIINSAPLNGEYTITPNIDFTWSSWFNGTYTDQKNAYINDNMGLRPDLIRLNNEIDYDLFDKIHSEWRLIGERGCIFQDMFIYSYLGRDYDGYPYIAEKVRKLKAIQDTLQKLGKSLVFVQSPCKAFFYPEFFPQALKNKPRTTTNYEVYKRVCDSMGVNQVDLNTWFQHMKDTSKELLYPKQGFHWSVYGSLLGADSVIKYIERLRNITMVHPAWTSIEHTTKARYTDDDIAKSMNLIFPLDKETFSYPGLSFTTPPRAVKPNMLYIGDSFLYTWISTGVMDNIAGHWQLWYYNSMLVDDAHPQEMKQPMDGYDRFAQISNADCIVIMYTSRNLSKLGKTFVEDTYDHFYPAK